jgi:hypothetical protein
VDLLAEDELALRVEHARLHTASGPAAEELFEPDR